jgi:hypothetical protein
MAQTLRILADWVEPDAWPHALCPSCEQGHLNSEPLVTVPTADAERLRGDDDWEPDWITGSFHGVLRCSLASCAEPVVVSGDYKVDMELAPDGKWFGAYAPFVRLRYAQPALSMITCPDATPDAAKAAIAAASLVVWIDPGAAANRLRLAIEEILTAQRVRRFNTAPGRKRRRLPTHTRIVEFSARKPAAADALMAVKWIGNEGSHADGLTTRDVLDGADMLAHALRLLYDTSADDLQRRIRSVNKKRGLPKAAAAGNRRPT